MKGSKMNLSFETEIIYEDAEFQIDEGDKVGIVGVNGAGKTTLFRILLGEQELDSGEIILGNASIAYLPQEIIIEDETCTVWDYLEDGRPIRSLEERLNKIYSELEGLEASRHDEQKRLLAEMAKLQTKLEYFDCYRAEETLLDIIEFMQIDIDLLDCPLVNLSGGQKSKIAFARVLYGKADILLLDEPTNHLDAATKNSVMKYLKASKAIILIISHDVAFLNQLINKTLFINKVTNKISVYKGDYDTYKKKYEQEQRLHENLIVQQEKEIKRLSDFVKRASQASRTNHALKRMGLERERRLEKKKQSLQKRERVYKRVRMDIRPRREEASIPIEVKNISFRYGGQGYLYKNLSFRLNKKERLLITGENGIGKSTLLKLIMAIYEPESGEICFDSKTDAAYYAQELETVDPQKSVFENVETEGYTKEQLRAVLSNFLFYEDDIGKKAVLLSPGEKARIALCKVLLKRANLLILDEPTNHLDPETQGIIAENFSLFEGTIIVVSHSQDFIEQLGISRVLNLPSGKITDY